MKGLGRGRGRRGRGRGTGVVYTTTEPSEALKLGGNIVVMDEGKVLQTGETSNVYRNPATVKTAELFSDPPINFFNGRIEADKVVIGQDLSFSTQAPFNTLETGSYQFGIRPNHLFLNPQADDDVQIRSKVEISEINGSETFIHFKFDGCQTVLHEVGIDTRKSGSDITAYVNPKYFFVYSQDGNLLVSPDGQASPAGQGEV